MSRSLRTRRGRGSGAFKMSMSSTMSLVRDTPRHVHFRYRHGVAPVVALVFGGGAWAAYTFIDDWARWLFGFGFGFFTLLIGVGAFWREELELDFATGRWRQRRGFVGKVRETRGALDEIPDVALRLNRRTSSEDSSSTWQVLLKAPAWPHAVTVFQSHKEEKGYEALEKWAKRLRKDAVDRTGDAEVHTPWDQLDEPLAQRNAAEGGDPDDFADAALASAYADPARTVSEQPPAGSGIVVTTKGGRPRIVLPALGTSSGVVFLFLFGLVFGGFGGFAAVVGLGFVEGVRVNGEIPDGPVWELAAIGAVFATIGLAIVLAPIVGSRARRWIEDRTDSVVVGYTGLGFTWSVKTLPKREIESVDLSASPNATTANRKSLKAPRKPTAEAARDVRIRTDEKVVRLGGDLGGEEMRWLRDRIERMARS